MPVTRRTLIATAGAALAAAALPGPPLAAAALPALPPPLPPEAFRGRQARLRAAAKERGLGALFVTPSTNLAYAADLAIQGSERLTALLLLTDGPAILVTPSFEEANHRRNAVVDEVKPWNEDENPIALSAKLLEGARAVGVEGSTPYQTVARLAAVFPGTLEDATPVFDALRRIKSKEEQVFIHAAAGRTILAIAATHQRIRKGMTERQVADILAEEYRKLGVQGDGLVQFGPSSAFPHGGPQERRLDSGDVILIDSGCKVRGYNSDVTRTAVFRSASDEVRRVHDIVERAQTAGIAALKAGAIPEEVDRAARKVIEDAGYGQFFTHRLGHGLGMDGHESPYLVHGNQTPLSAGNTVTVEPGIYMPGKFGVRIEDDYAVTAGVADGLSERLLELEVIGG
ncbi:MAG TPA: Xaa-Pro peptidase family protein [Thermoanaerobaculia bacterium]|nr:Xaa-Pro peptidase family protein [Thermoanaerobaculia bacterium]